MGLNSLTPESGPHTDEQPRSARAQELGLDANASWEDINAHTDEQRRKVDDTLSQ